MPSSLASAQKELTPRHIQHCFSNQTIRLKQEIAAILFECATEQQNPIKLKPTFPLCQVTAHALAREL